MRFEKRLSRLAATTATFGALSSLVFSLGATLALGPAVSTPESSLQIELAEEIEKRFQDQLLQIESRLASELNSLIADIDIPDDTEIGAKLQELDSKIDEAFEQLKIVDTIATAIQDSPERAMSIPILRRDVDALSENVTEDTAAVRAEVDRIYDLGKWFLGLIASMALGVLGLAVGNLLKSKD